MPKSSKKRKEKAADFSKAKLKLGKGKQIANNATDTSFKARSIALPQQSITITRDEGEPQTSRHLNLDTLLSRTKHYSAHTRRDAMTGLRELFDANPGLINSALGTLLHGTVKVITDEDPSVRRALLQLFSWLIPLVSKDNLVPHAAFLLLHIISALSHIFPEIRVDAIKFLDILLLTIPDAFSRSDEKILSGYLTLLNLRGKVGEEAPGFSFASLSLSPASKLVVFKSLARYIRIAVDGPSSLETGVRTSQARVPTWYLASSFKTETGYSAFLSLVGRSEAKARVVQWEPEVPPFSDEDGVDFNHSSEGQSFGLTSMSWNLDDMHHLCDENVEYDGNLRMMIELSRSLHPVLVATFLEVAPSAFMPPQPSASSHVIGSIESQLELLHATGELTALIYGTVLRRCQATPTKAMALEGLKKVISRMAPYFPFGEELICQRDMQTDQYLQDLNLVYCDLVSLLFTEQNRVSQLGLATSKERDEPLNLPPQLIRVSQWVSKAIRGQVVSGGQALGKQLSAAAYAALLPAVWSLLNTNPELFVHHGSNASGERSDGNVATDIWLALMEHYHRAGSKSSAKKLALEFIGLLILIQAERQYFGAFRLENLQSQDWLVSLPRFLWELSTSDPACSEVILLILLRVIQRPSLLSISAVDTLCTCLIPYFYIQHPTKGSVLGPWTRFDPDSLVHRLALQVVESLERNYGNSATQNLRSAVDFALALVSPISYHDNRL